ncbi:EcsC family protein [Solirhodobacter olei]|uniref:EcsC family protein n=1 Tax=Solirhodobacter olei TaxID=2493082 RepID=UPI000FD935B9|nr:EcsC family protein [Solirhodobacter olei]
MSEPNTEIVPAREALPMDRIAALAARHRKAGGAVMAVINAAGSRIENRLEKLPDGVKDRLEKATATALERSYRLAGETLGEGPKIGDRGHLALATLTGAFGGLGGIGTAIAELPLTVTVIFRGLQKIAESYGYDPKDPTTRLECLQVFGAGGPLKRDDGVNTSFLGARVTITGGTLNRVVAAVAPRFASVLGEKLAAEAVPLLGAVAGAGINYAFVTYYQEMAHVRFGLKRLAETHGEEAVLDAFRAALA